MAAPMDDVVSECVIEESDTMCYIEATVTTGLEQIAREEALEMISKEVKVARGHIIIKLPIKDVKKVLELRCVDNCSVMMTQAKKFPFSQDELDCMRKLRELVRDVNWEKGLAAWNQIFTFKNPIPSKPDHNVESLGEPYSTRRINKPKKGDKSAEGKGGNRGKGKWDNTKKKQKKKRAQGQVVVGGCSEEDCKMSVDVNKSDENIDEILEKESEGITDLTASDKVTECDTKSVTENTDLASTQNDERNETSLNNKVLDLNSHLCETKVCQSDKRNSDVGNISDEEKPAKKPKVRVTNWDPEKPTFRVTCKRGGKNHPFDSMGAAANFGGAVNEYFKWNVDMTKFDIEVILNIEETEVRVCLALTRESLHKRNITEFGRTTLRPTIAANMLRLCKLETGDVICDPLCGTGSISVEAAVRWQSHYNLGGDISKKVLFNYLANIEGANKYENENSRPDLKLGIARWDCCSLPLRDGCVDVFITDLPFGIRSGSKRNNWKLYPGVLYEMARVARPGVARACLLSEDRKCITNVINVLNKYWTRKQVIGFNLGGLAASLYILHRTKTQIDKSQPPPIMNSPPKKESKDESSRSPSKIIAD